jgi:glycogen debranching enzyme
VLTILEGANFCVCNDSGDIEGDTEGFFALDTRFLSCLRLTIDGLPPRLLDGRQVEYFSALVFLRNDLSPRLRADELLIRRERFVGGHLHDRVVLLNVSQRDLALRLGIELAADFADILSVKQHDVALGEPDHAPAFPAAVRPVQRADPTQLVLAAPEGDLWTEIAASRPLTLDDEGDIEFQVELAPNDEWTVDLTAEPCVDGTTPRSTPATHQFGEERDRTADALRSWQLSVPQLHSPDATVAGAFHRSIVDLAALRMPVDGVRSARLPAAGVPWFMTIFGRDTLITCLQTLLLGPDLARTALQTLAELQAVSDEPQIDADPGKILHELRHGRAAVNWFSRYYGSIDATPLFLVLLSEVWRWTGDDDLVDSLRPAALAALRWIDDHGDPDGDGFVEFERRAPGGLEVQSWKDSWDSQRYADGTVAEPPIAAAEVQGYVFDAKVRLAEIALVVWRDRELAARLEHEAAVLSQRFDRSFWIDEGAYYALALDRNKVRVDSHCSNMGQLLWSGIVPAHRVDAISDQLFSDGLWSGWGVRTMSRHDSAYGPLAYHNGTVWPHDNSLIAWGLARYGRHGEARRIARTLLAASSEFGHALPEVFTGLARSTTPFPVPYPTASRPQAWAAATPVLLLRIMLGLEPDRERGSLVSRCTDPLPAWLEGTALRGIPAFDTTWDAVVTDGAVSVTPAARRRP